ncbi:hypothetical protein QCA50_011313 [Cerrena zonata]|uniref:Macro domain-like protein n=1 Tax=Cerrena zonata TaxID=2478898 RepID=A0AAW0G8V3_9APHY
MDDLYITILDPSQTLSEELDRAFKKHLPETVQGRFMVAQTTLEHLKEPYNHFDCIVSPANSYGRLDGGFDWFISEALAPPGSLEVPTQLAQATLYQKWKGYAPPGTCTLVSLLGSVCEKNKHDCAYIALCPTMRTPGSVSWNKEIVYNCVWSLLTALTNHNALVDEQQKSGSTGERRIRTVVMTGLATGVGAVSPIKFCQQMVLAIRDFVQASADPKKWSTLEWEDILKIAADTQKTHDL